MKCAVETRAKCRPGFKLARDVLSNFQGEDSRKSRTLGAARSPRIHRSTTARAILLRCLPNEHDQVDYIWPQQIGEDRQEALSAFFEKRKPVCKSG